MSRVLNMTAAFELQLNTPVNARQVDVGSFDGKTPSLVAATSGGKVLIHSPQVRGGDPIRFLNVNRTISAICVGKSTKTKTDILYVGGGTSLVAYDVERNSDMFFKEVSDGIHTMVNGRMAGQETDLAIVGGNCSLQGFDEGGEERFWTVTGDNVAAISLTPWDSQESRNLVVASEDLEIRVYRNEEVLCQVTETAPVSQLTPTGALGRFVFALGNGTIGVYEKQQRAWRAKSKHKAVATAACDVDFDGVAEILVGWDNGKFEVRSDTGAKAGESMFKYMFEASVHGIAVSDYRSEGRPIPMVVTADGTTKGFVAVETAMDEAVLAADQTALEKMMQEKQDLQFELDNLAKQIEKRADNTQTAPMPENTEIHVKAKLKPNRINKSVDLVLNVNGSGAVIQGIGIQAEVIFGDKDSLFITSDAAGESLTAAFQLEKDAPAELRISTMVGFSGSDSFQVHELSVKLPKFAMYVPVKELPKPPSGLCTIRATERVNRFVMWAQANFSGFTAAVETKTEFVGHFVSLRDGSGVTIHSSTTAGEIIIRTDKIDVAGDLVQDLASSLALTDVQCVADFPDEFEAFQQVLNKVDEFNAARLKLTAEMADSSQLVKALVIKAEDARLLGDMRHMQRTYNSLYELNKELLVEFMKRSNNHQELLSALKEVNAMIQKAARLRVGQPKTQLIADCRTALKDNQTQAIFNIIRTGKQ